MPEFSKLDLQEINSISANDINFAIQIVELNVQKIEEIQLAIHTLDEKEVRFLLHKLKSSLLYVLKEEEKKQFVQLELQAKTANLSQMKASWDKWYNQTYPALIQDINRMK